MNSRIFVCLNIGLTFFLLSTYCYFIPETGFQFLNHPKWASWLFGIFIFLLPVIIFLSYQFFKVTKSYADSQESIFSMMQINQHTHKMSSAKSAFLATISHEIRNPLQAIIGTHELLLSDALMSRESRSLVKNAYQTSKSLLSILNQVLDLSKIESGKIDLRQEPTSIKSLLSDLIESFQVLCQHKANHINLHFDKVLAHSLMIDRTRLQQVLSNLISNSIKFTQNGQIFIIINVLNDTHAEQILQFQIIDTGCGIPEKDLERIIEPYERSASLQNQEIPGTGLGLSITNALLGSMGSQLHLESKPNLGTSASFKIKFKRSSSLPKSPLTDLSTINHVNFKKSFSGKTALIVDDYPACREVICKQLTHLGFECFQSENAIDGLNFLSSRQVDLVVSDEFMPNISGREFAKTLKQKYPKIKIIILTGDTQFEEKLNHDDVDLVSAFFIKPIELKSLFKCLNILFKKNDLRWDFNRLLDFTNQDLSAARTVLRSIISTQEEIVELMEKAPKPLEPFLISSLCHKTLGGAKLINARTLMNYCLEFRDSNTKNQTNLINLIQDEILQLNQQMQNFLNTKNSDII